MRNLKTLLILVIFCQTLFGQITLVKDINTTGDANPIFLTNVNGELFFRANSGNIGSELWKSDGTNAGTTLIKDFYFAGSSGPSQFQQMNGSLFFSAKDTTNGNELWKSDGTASGTMLLKNINSTISNSANSDPRELTDVNGMLFFQANDGNNGVELWKTDGTPSGTVLVKDISIGSSSPSHLINVNGTLFFKAFEGANYGYKLYKSDGTISGTVLVKDINPGNTGPFNNSSPFTDVNGTLFFRANDGIHGEELWKSDGTTSGTVMVKDINSGSNWSTGQFIKSVNVNGILFFMAQDGIHFEELWKSDGTASGTQLVKDICSGCFGSPYYLTNVNGTLYFSADNDSNGRELWKSDGTTAGTVMVKDILIGGVGSFPQYLTNVNGMLYFSANDGVHGEELWRSDGTTSGTVMVQDMPGLGFGPVGLTLIGDTLYFTANRTNVGRELWKYIVPDSCISQNIIINPGWNLISGYINPSAPDMTDVFNDISLDILLVKNGAGQTYIQSLGINSISNWQVEQGYKVKSSTAAILTISCEQVDPTNTPITVTQGWNIISYLRTSPMSATTALSSISGNMLIMKNGSGGTFIPSIGINTIGDLLPGQGYKVKMGTADVLYYPGN